MKRVAAADQQSHTHWRTCGGGPVSRGDAPRAAVAAGSGSGHSRGNVAGVVAGVSASGSVFAAGTACGRQQQPVIGAGGQSRWPFS